MHQHQPCPNPLELYKNSRALNRIRVYSIIGTLYLSHRRALKNGYLSQQQQHLICWSQNYYINFHQLDLMLFLPGELEQAAEKICVTDSGATPNKPCIFPFKFNGVLYNECTWTSAHLTEHKPWCSTFVDETGERSIFLMSEVDHYQLPTIWKSRSARFHKTLFCSQNIFCCLPACQQMCLRSPNM